MIPNAVWLDAAHLWDGFDEVLERFSLFRRTHASITLAVFRQRRPAFMKINHHIHPRLNGSPVNRAARVRVFIELNNYNGSHFFVFSAFFAFFAVNSPVPPPFHPHHTHAGTPVAPPRTSMASRIPDTYAASQFHLPFRIPEMHPMFPHDILRRLDADPRTPNPNRLPSHAHPHWFPIQHVHQLAIRQLQVV
jgi:hypothetical protein